MQRAAGTADQTRHMGTALQHLRLAARYLLRRPALTGTAILSLTLAIGANTLIFSFIDATFLRTLPVRDPHQLVQFGHYDAREWNQSFSYPAFELFRQRTELFTGMFAYDTGRINAVWRGQGEIVNGQIVSGNTYHLLGLSPALGRLIAPSDDRVNGGNTVVVLTHRYWLRRFGGDRQVLGRPLILNRVAFTIIGVLPQGFDGVTVGEPVDLAIPLSTHIALDARPEPFTSPGHWWLRIIARKRPGLGDAEAQAALAPLFAETLRMTVAAVPAPMATMIEEVIKEKRFRVVPAARGAVSGMRESYSRPLLFLMAAVGVLLLIACANVANLLLAHAVERRGEVGLRMALGATVPRLVGQLLTESVLLALIGGALGVLLATWGMEALLRFLPADEAVLQVFPRFDARVLSFTLGVCLATVVIFGLVPALRATQLDLTLTLRGSVHRQATATKSRLRRGLVAAQLALCLVLLTAAGLLTQSLRNLGRESVGVQRDRLFMFRVDPSLAGYPDVRRRQYYSELIQRLRALPGVTSATVSRFALPLSGDDGQTTMVNVPGYQPRSQDDQQIGRNVVGPAFAHTLGLTIVDGRDLTTNDMESGPRVAIVNEAFVRRYFPHVPPVGRELNFMDQPDQPYRIVGVVKDTRDRWLRAPPTRMVYTPFLQEVTEGMVVTVATTRRPADVLPEALHVTQAIDGLIPIYEAKTMDTHVTEQLRREQLVSALAGLFGMVALMLASVGLYGLLSYLVAQRIGEIGMRMALGASRVQVIRLVLREMSTLMLVGLTIGLVASLSVTHLMGGLLYGLSPRDPRTLLGVTVLLFGIASLASYLPARRASRVNPADALRWE
ncbi:MAG: FtsX-like permease family protein [Luteitalea sp.]|nr:FtsX-like permease family protein [Luteitalea sp.]